MYAIRPIRAEDDPKIAAIIRANLEKYRLDVPGTAYFDPELAHLSRYYAALPAQRAYYVAEDAVGQVVGGAGFAEFCAFPGCAELQKLYLAEGAKGRGLGRRLLEEIEERAKASGYQRLYLETHSVLERALRLYERAGFSEIEKPAAVLHSTMDRFYIKNLV